MNENVSIIAQLRRLTSVRRFLKNAETATFVSDIAMRRTDYCNSPLFVFTHDVTSNLHQTQNYAAEVILRITKSTNIAIHFQSLHWLNVKARSTYKIA